MGVLLTYVSGSAENVFNGPGKKNILNPPHGKNSNFNRARGRTQVPLSIFWREATKPDLLGNIVYAIVGSCKRILRYPIAGCHLHI